MEEDYSALIDAEVEALIAERLKALVATLERAGLRRESIVAGLSRGLEETCNGAPPSNHQN